MKANKIVAALVVCTMMLSTLVVMNQLNVPIVASAQPGVDAWGNATTELTYGIRYNTVAVNTTDWGVSFPSTLYLFYPRYYVVSPGVATNFTWVGPYEVDGYPVRITATGDVDNLNTAGQPITFNRSGMWAFGTSTSPPPAGTSPVGYLWVNTSTNYTLSVNRNSITYGAAEPIEITVNEGGSPVGSMVSVLDPDNNTIYHAYRAAGAVAELESDDFAFAGEYTILAYRDLDIVNSVYYYGDEGGDAYTSAYGMGITVYDYNVVGPFDPPEKNATPVTFTVETGRPVMTLSNTSFYWGFEGRIDVNVTNSTGAGLDNVSAIKIRHGNVYYNESDLNLTIGTYGDPGNYSIEFTPWTSPADPGSWGGTMLINGTWYVVFGEDTNNDGTYEWNTTKSFSITGANPPVRIKMLSHTDGEIPVPEYVYPAGNAPTVNIVFQILGRSLVNDEGRAYYGDDAWEDWKNITVEGDILYPVTETTLTHSTQGTWTAVVTPTKPNGNITITIDWPGDNNGTDSEALEITDGTNVQTSASEFTIGQDFNLTVTVTDPDGDALKYANVTLIWEDLGTILNTTNGNNAAENGLNGEYTFWITEDDQPATAPQNITIAASSYANGEGFWGYATVVLNKNHNMAVNVTPTASYAGDGTLYDVGVTLVGGGNPANAGLTIAIYNETGALVDPQPVGWPITGKYNPVAQEIDLPAGTYHIFAYNATHDSQGNNATFVITAYRVNSSPSVLAWKIDDDANVTFQVSPNVNGTLRLQNMSDTNAANTTLGTTIDIINGVGNIEGINASELGNVTYFFTPDGGSEQPAEGMLRITTATATPTPARIYLNEATTVTVTVTHPATNQPLSGVWVSLDNDKSNSSTVLARIPNGASTNAAGQVQFGLNALGSGNITIFMENETDPDNEFVIIASARSTMTISVASPSVNEGEQFTVSIRQGTALLTNTTVTITFAGQTMTTSNGQATLTAPAVSANLIYPITATADGYTDASTSVTVLNVPQLIVAVLTANVRTGQSFQVAVADDSGSPIIGATVTMNGATATTGSGGVATLTAPNEAGNYTITATFGQYKQATQSVNVGSGGGVPGFELLTLLVAVGIAFLLLRRRRV